MIGISFPTTALTVLKTIKILWPLWIIIGIFILLQITIEIIKIFVKKQKYYTYKINFWRNSHESTSEASKLGNLLKEYGWNIELEKWDGYKSIDISVPDARVDIEVDGSQHNISEKQALADLKRTYYSFKKDGYITLRIPNVLTQDEMALKKTVDFINKFLRESEARL